MEVLRRGTHIDMRSGVIAQAWNAWNECSEVGGLLRLQDCVSDGSYLEIYSVTNRKPVQFRQNRRDMIKARLLGHTIRVQGCSEQAVGEIGLKQMCRREENCSNRAVIPL